MLRTLPGKTVGLLGGSFNPAHDGHLHISRLAIKQLNLDHVWWLVSPQNPLKSSDRMASLSDRMVGARAVTAREKRISVTDIEVDLGTQYTADTLQALKKRYPKVRFVWIMGGDNLVQMSQWKDWERIFELVNIAIFARPTYTLRALSSKAARRFARYRLNTASANRLAEKGPPAWVFMPTKLHPESATNIRVRRGGQE